MGFLFQFHPTTAKPGLLTVSTCREAEPTEQAEPVAYYHWGQVPAGPMETDCWLLPGWDLNGFHNGLYARNTFTLVSECFYKSGSGVTLNSVTHRKV